MKQDKKANFLPIVLVILDGWGIAPAAPSNPISLAKLPNWDFFNRHYPHTELIASGAEVGLPHGQDGNSEAGHMNIGAGRVVKQDAVIVSEMIKNKKFFKSPALLSAIKHAKKFKSNLHVMGLLSNGESAHSDPQHLYSLLKFFKQQKFHRIYLHLFTDGRDSPPHAAARLISKLINNFQNNEIISTIMGRYYAMDRIKKWSRTEMAYDAMVLGHGIKADNPYHAITQAYNRGEIDEFITPTIILNPVKKAKFINNNDSIIFFNLRSDRARQITKTFVQEKFEAENSGAFKRKKILKNLCFVAMTDFGPDLDDIKTVSHGIVLNNTLPIVLKNYRQLYLAEREKYAHVTYFFNGGYNHPLNGEKWDVLASKGMTNYEHYPQMSIYPLTDIILKNLQKKKDDFITVNFANADMIGHTGNLKAGIKAVQIVDACLGRIYKEILKAKGTLIITADHGNVEEMLNLKTGEMDTEHSNNPVPFIIINNKFKKFKLKSEGKLGDIAPTILTLMGVKQPKEMTGHSLILKYKG
ncbi:MAG: 2,3-bisphosphoglycerate-independent phosphoglycerate mutase [Candidatus Parcubacteria bacterium]|nr:2,3-bisphosphoglycerate-independent phosphoglycerate mutase [Candidatus Parcubacteria bacterium]